jgi:hypothetical protein
LYTESVTVICCKSGGSVKIWATKVNGGRSIVKNFVKGLELASFSAAVLFMSAVSCGPTGASPENSRHDGGEEHEQSQVGTAKARELEKVTGAHTRVVWVQDLAEGKDIGAMSTQLLLMGFDSHDGRGERPILAEPANYAKPLITPLGDRIVFSNHLDRSVFVVNWDGTGLRRLGEGFALATWIDPDTKQEWIYLGMDPSPDPTTFGNVRRHRIDQWDVSEVVWDRRRVSEDTFQVSTDGRRAGGLFPWPAAGVVELPKGAWRRMGRGCWTSLARGDRSLFWYFDGAHRNLTIVDLDRDKRWKVNINGAPGIDGYEIYHPRWTSHPRFLVMTGPYNVGTKSNKIRDGGRQVEIYLGRFNADFTAVDGWVKVTNNERADFFPDAWIESSEKPLSPGTDDVGPGSKGSPASQKWSDRLVVEARVVESAPIPTPKSILPYRRALLVNEYEIVQVVEGTYEETKILVAHWVIRNGQVLSTAVREEGTVHRLTLEAYDSHAELEGERLVMDSDAFNLRLYYDTQS